MRTIGLIGTITADTIRYDDGRSFRNIGGILYQAAVLCGLGVETALFTNCGEALRPEVEGLTADWGTLRRGGCVMSSAPAIKSSSAMASGSRSGRKSFVPWCLPSTRRPSSPGFRGWKP